MEKIVPVSLEQQMKDSYLDYAMSVIISRALPDVRDGLKPVQRRILVTMNDLNLTHSAHYRKCAKICGDVSGNYHPHGEAIIYPSLVRLAQDFSLRYLLVDGQGNFGSVDGDPPAAMRYTEARMTRISEEMLADIDFDTVDFVPNYDGTLKEPVVLPGKFPNLLLNGATGIAVGMATSIPPHNLGEVIDAIIKLIEDPEITVDEISNIIKGPDFPTGGIIAGISGIKSAYTTGRGLIILRAKWELEENKGKNSIIITEIPYMVNKSQLIQKIGELWKQKKVEGIVDIRDESDRNGMRIVIEIRRDINEQILMNYLFKHTQLQTTFGVIMLALVENTPRILNIKSMLEQYVKFRVEVIIRRTKFELRKAQERLHIVEGLLKAISMIDQVIETIKESPDVPIAKTRLQKNFGLTEKQAQAILEMRLQRLTGLEREKLEEEQKELSNEIEKCEKILGSKEVVMKVIKSELIDIKKKYNDERRTDIILDEVKDVDIADLIQKEDVVITMTKDGWAKRVPVNTYRTQLRGGVGVRALSKKEEDIVKDVFVASTHDDILFFSADGLEYRKKGYEIPSASRQSKGTPIVNILKIEKEQRIAAMIPISSFDEDKYLFMVTRKGKVKKSKLIFYKTCMSRGKIGIRLKPGDELCYVALTDGNRDVIIGTKNGYIIRFSEKNVRPMGRGASGVRGIRLREGDEVVGVDVIDDEAKDILVVSEKGFGKRTRIALYRKQRRGGKGILTVRVTEKTGKLVSLALVYPEDELLIISKNGIIIREKVKSISRVGRVTQGVKLIKVAPGDEVGAVEVLRFKKEENVSN